MNIAISDNHIPYSYWYHRTGNTFHDLYNYLRRCDVEVYDRVAIVYMKLNKYFQAGTISDVDAICEILKLIIHLHHEQDAWRNINNAILQQKCKDLFGMLGKRKIRPPRLFGDS